MAGQVKNLKIKGGRFYARVSVPAHLRPILGKSELVTALGGERRAAMKALPAAVATLQRQIAAAEAKTAGDRLNDLRTPITTADYGSAVWKRYQAMLAEDEVKRDRLPSMDAIEAEQDRLMQRARAGQVALADGRMRTTACRPTRPRRSSRRSRRNGAPARQVIPMQRLSRS
ncbi:DUF6538 domain-containing protein [Paracoccus binzhouensis]|uniref:DUF6538 domain-containing protein n=1 Tax=Paracoccus binzhouensis TaxID=2796149 RepID=UPI0018EF0CCA|nr:DUF6538 domain-containing protein [Paracoccus binzhouensis]